MSGAPRTRTTSCLSPRAVARPPSLIPPSPEGVRHGIHSHARCGRPGCRVWRVRADCAGVRRRPSAHHPAEAATAPQNDGEVRKVDKEQGKVTLRHGPLQNLDMPAMTVVFKVADPKVLDSLKEGDKVKFTAEKVNGAFTVMSIQRAE